MSADTTMTTPAPASSAQNIDPAIFTSLQAKIDEESAIRDELKTFVETLSKQGRLTQSILSRIHNTPTAELEAAVLDPCNDSLSQQAATVKELAQSASKFPFYKWNNIWQRDIQAVISSMQICDWLKSGKLLTLEEIGQRLNVPVNLKSEDAFHITIEDYLLALTTTIEELARLAPNAVTLGDYSRPLQISIFIKDVHAGFQLLNLKNDNLRRRSDGIKYSVKKVEDVVYDLSLRGLIPKSTDTT
ncbi:Translin-1 [Elasticomyces elasticus]|uniref:Translin-1 n=1 Tax=Exophiala sideris TaxID=1016849 RepID=A0ABR0JPQ5_9EURO|nr:Translin-1 [Elasticomyces elasticus]KAK5039578.1 Translin-1 [Exophiala sideris]KAK5041130.1 Translin-1 [Exophiala sideris]KAK5067955.1 Translin-1 [Exophiala sideris]KAK5187257.1 Translin-1 [Eurotiomycetes sp. CCFEE 6388]